MSDIQPIDIASRREPLWDDTLIDTARSTAEVRVHRPQAREVVLLHDEPWEGDGCDFHNIVVDDDCYRMYYLAWRTGEPTKGKAWPRQFSVCYAESKDGLTWEKPNLGLCEYAGSRDNNILLDKNTLIFDNFYVFKDPNPACPPSERYKGVALDKSEDRCLRCFVSADGLHFEKAWPITEHGKFDTLNIAFWDATRERYLCYVRDFHRITGEDLLPDESHEKAVRDVRWLESKDFRHWSKPRRLDFGDAPDVPLYTNVTQPYYRADHVLVGFPSRYIERKAWTPSFDDLPNPERRRAIMEGHPRYGLTLTDCVFMTSRDGAHWRRFDEAFMTPGPQREVNWVYGDCYPSVGMIETPSHLRGAPQELSMYAFDNHWSQRATELRRYTLRVDGFVSRHAPYRTRHVITKPLVFAGNALSLNFATSAAGHVKIRLIGESATFESCEIFGDSIDRQIAFPDGDIAQLAGQPIVMEIELRDADVYSFQFGA